MKVKYKYIVICVLGLIFASCEEFLDRPPYDNFTDDEFWMTETQTRSYMYSFYTSVFSGYGSGISHGPFLMGQTLNDDFASDISQKDLTPLEVPVSDGGWDFSLIRKANYVIENIERLDADAATINHWTGIARFFRAVYYSNMVFRYGDVPYMDHVPIISDKKEDLDYLYKDRDPRAFVVDKILEDFQFAMDNVRINDGALQINKYVVAGMASRMMLREGTFLKYHNIDLAKAEKCLLFAKNAALLAMSGPYSISDSYNALFASDDLAGNAEILMYRKYLDGVLAHSTLAYSYQDPQGGASKSLAESFSKSNGFPIYYNDEFWTAPTDSAFFADRDPRLSLCIRPKYYLKGGDNSPFAYTLSGYSWCKFMDDSKAGQKDPTFARERNVTDAPCLRLGEVLLNYVEAAYELHLINDSHPFGQEDLDKSINLLRARSGIDMPALQFVGGKPAVDGEVYDDPKRSEINPEGDVDPMLWEIRRERRVELCFEGFRLNDLKRWKKLDYLWNGINPDIRYGAYIRLDDYPDLDASVVLEDDALTEGYILRNTERQRNRPIPRNYINPVPSGQIQLYKSHGYTLTQTKEWAE